MNKFKKNEKIEVASEKPYFESNKKEGQNENKNKIYTANSKINQENNYSKRDQMKA